MTEPVDPFGGQQPAPVQPDTTDSGQPMPTTDDPGSGSGDDTWTVVYASWSLIRPMFLHWIPRVLFRNQISLPL